MDALAPDLWKWSTREMFCKPDAQGLPLRSALLQIGPIAASDAEKALVRPVEWQVNVCARQIHIHLTPDEYSCLTLKLPSVARIAQLWRHAASASLNLDP